MVAQLDRNLRFSSWRGTHEGQVSDGKRRQMLRDTRYIEHRRTDYVGQRCRRICGMVTDRDICMAAYLRGILLTGAAVSTAMTKSVFSCSPEDDVHDTEKLMREKQLRRIPIVDAHGQVAGIISIADIARWTQQEARAPTDAELTRVMASVCARRR